MASLIKRNWKTGPAWYIQYYVGNQQRRIHASNNFQIAKEKLRRFEAAKAAGDDLPLPTRTLIPDILTAYVQHIRQVKTAKSAQTDIYYLRDMFGPVCDELKINSRKQSTKARKKPPKAGVNARTKAPVIEADCMEAIRTADITTFISAQVARRGLAPKTANRYREILMRLFNWAMEQKNVRMPNDKNPAAKVERYKEPAPTIHFLTLKQIEEQLDALTVRFASKMPWPLTFSFARAIQHPALDIWSGHESEVKAAQEALIHRAECSRAARCGKYSSEIEHLSVSMPLVAAGT